VKPAAREISLGRDNAACISHEMAVQRCVGPFWTNMISCEAVAMVIKAGKWNNKGTHTLKTGFGEHTRPGCCWTRLASSFLAFGACSNLANFFDALDVSRAGAENGTRGACAPPD